MDDRFEKLASELRASRPVAPDPLRERVASFGEAEPASPRWTFGLPSRRIVLGLAGATLLASFVAAGVTGHTRSSNRLSAQKPKTTTVDHSGVVTGGRAQENTPSRQAAKTPVLSALAPNGSPSRQAAKTPVLSALAPNGSRLQRYEATLRLRVKDVDALSNGARRAMSLTRSLGGYVASVDYATRGGKRGGATLALRVPVASIQTALGELASLGTMLQQHTGILDVTRRADRESAQIAKLQRELETADPQQAAAIRARLKTLRAKHARLLRSAQFARITLSLTTPAKQAAAAPSRFDRTLDDAGSVLLRELEILLYALVVAGPLLLLGGAAMLAGRRVRRQADSRLLDRV